MADDYAPATRARRYADRATDAKLHGGGLYQEPDLAPQDPNDYLEVFKRTMPPVLSYNGTGLKDVTRAGSDFAVCTMLPTTKDGTPVCFLPEYCFSER